MKNQRAAVRRLAALGGALELSSHRVVIRLPNPKLFQLVVRTVILALFLLSFPWIKYSASSILHHHHRSDNNASNFLADLRRLGLLKADGRSVFLGDSGSLHPVLISNRVEPVDMDQKSAIADSTVDFLFFDGDVDFELADRVLKTGGILAVRLSLYDEQFVPSSNYKIVHTSRFGSAAIVAARKISIKNMKSRKLLQSKKQALSGLEDAVLEPPTKKKYRQKTRYLPDLLGGSQLADYPRRVFVDVGPAGRAGSEEWFENHYPKKNLEFEVIRIDEAEAEAEAEEVGMNEWAKRNLMEKEYVVMRAEAEVVEEMVKGGTIGLVDELFLECKNQWWVRGSKRAYWECLALYGRLTDEGVAVHQWWGD